VLDILLALVGAVLLLERTDLPPAASKSATGFVFMTEMSIRSLSGGMARGREGARAHEFVQKGAPYLLRPALEIKILAPLRKLLGFLGVAR
jgi:hypothetical protein